MVSIDRSMAEKVWVEYIRVTVFSAERNAEEWGKGATLVRRSGMFSRATT